MLHFVRKLYRNRRGAAAVEYALICAFIVLAMMAALFQFGAVTTNLWNTIDNKVAAKGNG